ncbi:MAG: plasmid stabilization protein [Candidatus Chisholmbacteria bacterium]|nr:plasmid stabilization protein [Candidatus Chisholmbacteria bacterium]
MKLIATSRFDRELVALIKAHRVSVGRIEKMLALLLINSAHPSLRLHKLSGTNNYSVSVNMKLRVIIHFETEQIYLLRIGSHEEVY